jgi:hypothetical protein
VDEVVIRVRIRCAGDVRSCQGDEMPLAECFVMELSDFLEDLGVDADVELVRPAAGSPEAKIV